MMSDSRLEVERWRAELSSENAAERGDAAESPPDGAPSDEVVAALTPLLLDPVDVVRLCAAETLGQVGGPAAVAALRALVAREDDPLVKAYGLSSLGLAGTSQDLPILLSETAEDRPAQIRIHALVGLYELVRRGVKHGLLGLLAHERSDVRGAAAKALASVLEERDDGDAMQRLEQGAANEPVEGPHEAIIGALQRLQGDSE